MFLWRRPVEVFLYTCTHGWCYATVLCQYTCTTWLMLRNCLVSVHLCTWLMLRNCLVSVHVYTGLMLRNCLVSVHLYTWLMLRNCLVSVHLYTWLMLRLVTVQQISWTWTMIPAGFTHEDTAKVKKTECRPLKTSRTWGKMHIPHPKSHFYHRPSAHTRNYGQMHGSHPNFEKLTVDFMLRRHYTCAFYTVICGIFITSLLSDLSPPRRYIRPDPCFYTIIFAGYPKSVQLYLATSPYTTLAFRVSKTMSWLEKTLRSLPDRFNLNPLRQVEMKHEAGEQTDYRCREDFLQKLGPTKWSGEDRWPKWWFKVIFCSCFFC